jgi:dihydrofolate reductase
MKMIVCCDIKGGFSKDKKIPWLNEAFSKADLKRFRKLTLNSVVVMGRNTYNEIASLNPKEIKGSILPNRECYVLTSNPNRKCKGAITISSIEDIKTEKDVFIIGGYSLYLENIDKCNTVYLSRINKDYNCDQLFPEYLLSTFTKYEETSEFLELSFETYSK